MKLKCLGNAIIYQLLAVEKKTAGGLTIPDRGKYGVVAFVGQGIKDEKLTVKVGDTVLLQQYTPGAGPIYIDGTPHYSCVETDVIAIVEE